ncbi:DUF1345 domain-containing protein [Sandaracinobacteroides hominis]|uniref:DUF1345 domain-containing protein n=1 Tax=Sandaracinobacteroides hominis TaxID=2780086 RepID=UPI0018F53981|nr:DUF1345 domain-containing protein [Sandaracinobacteroides hominis]
MNRIGNRLGPPRFLTFLLVMLGVCLFSIPNLGTALGLLAGFDAGALVFLLISLPLLKHHTPADMRRHAGDNDANRPLMLMITTIVSMTILVAIFWLMHSATSGMDKLGIIGSLALAWLFSNTVYALHYAHLHYRRGSKGGLQFSGKEQPDYSDFIYFAFTLGMTFQTSDTAVESREMRQAVTMHCLAAFLFNLGVISFTINVLGQR